MSLSRSIGSRFDGLLGATALDTRLTLASLVARRGVFPGAPAALVVGVAQGGWNYQVHAASFATSRGSADGSHILSNSGPELVPTDAAPGTSGASRIDIIYVLQPSKGENTDTTSTPVFGVAKGQASTSQPIAPSLPPGALELARNTMTNAATSTASVGNSIQQSWRYTALRGAQIIVRNQAERDELTDLATAAYPLTVDRLDTGVPERNAGSGWAPIVAPVDPSGFLGASAALAGANPPAGTKLLKRIVNATVNSGSAGRVAVAFGYTFPNGVVACTPTLVNGNSLGAWVNLYGAPSQSQCIIQVLSGTNAVPNVNALVSIVVEGW
jgi:hypothetical protein